MTSASGGLFGYASSFLTGDLIVNELTNSLLKVKKVEAYTYTLKVLMHGDGKVAVNAPEFIVNKHHNSYVLWNSSLLNFKKYATWYKTQSTSKKFVDKTMTINDIASVKIDNKDAYVTTSVTTTTKTKKLLLPPKAVPFTAEELA